MLECTLNLITQHLIAYDARITCDGKRVEQFGEDRDGDTLSCWIPSVAGAQFSVAWKYNNREHASSGALIIFLDDGNSYDPSS